MIFSEAHSFGYLYFVFQWNIMRRRELNPLPLARVSSDLTTRHQKSFFVHPNNSEIVYPSTNDLFEQKLTESHLLLAVLQHAQFRFGSQEVEDLKRRK